MHSSGISDLSSMMRLQRFGFATRSDLDKAAYEVSSGKKADLIEATKGDLAPLFSIEKTLGRLSQRAGTINMAAAKSAATQLALENIQINMAPYGVELLSAVDLDNQAQAFTIANSARSAFNNIVSSLNSDYAGRSLFAGAGTDGPALIDGNAMYADIIALTAGAPDALTAIAAVDDYFYDAAGGFATTGFQGSLLDAAGAEVADGDVIEYAVRGDMAEIRAALRNVALVAVAAGRDHGGTDLDGMVIFREAANGALTTNDGLISVRETLGHKEERFEVALVQNLAKQNMFEINRNAIISADPYEAATRYQALEGQMESVYIMTSRLSGLSLQNYLR